VIAGSSVWITTLKWTIPVFFTPIKSMTRTGMQGSRVFHDCFELNVPTPDAARECSGEVSYAGHYADWAYEPLLSAYPLNHNYAMGLSAMSLHVSCNVLFDLR